MKTFNGKTRYAVVLGLGLLVVGTRANAEIDLYDKDGKKLHLLLELQAAVFNGSDAYFGEAESFVGDDVDHWSENAVEFGIGGELPAGATRLFGEVSALHTRSYGDDATGFSVGLDDPSETRIEQGHIGWSSGSAFSSLDENALTVKAGRFDYRIGTGLLVADGGGDGGGRGGWWIGARKAFKDAALVSFDSGPWLVEAFTMKNQPRRGSAEGRGWGGNFERAFGESLKLGFSAIHVTDTGLTDVPSMNVGSIRGDWSFGKGWSLSGEYVEQGQNDWEGEGYYAQGAYQWKNAPWAPRASYRYSHLSGDDLDTVEREGFNPVAYGSSDWGTWYQGEITGNYPLENSNLNTHQVRLQLTPTEELKLNVLFYHFTLDENNIFGVPLSDDDFGDEVNVTADWTVTEHVYVIGTLGYLMPGDAGEEWTGGNDDWLYSMAYVSYTF